MLELPGDSGRVAYRTFEGEYRRFNNYEFRHQGVEYFVGKNRDGGGKHISWCLAQWICDGSLELVHHKVGGITDAKRKVGAIDSDRSAFREPRDSQRQKLYDAEDVTRRAFSEDTVSREELQALSDEITSSAWWKDRISSCPPHVDHVRVEVSRSHLKSTGGGRVQNRTRRVRLSPGWGHSRYIFLHELAHCAMPYQFSFRHAAHGAEYAGILLYLVENFYSAEFAAHLRESFQKFSVKYDDSYPHLYPAAVAAKS